MSSAPPSATWRRCAPSLRSPRPSDATGPRPAAGHRGGSAVMRGRAWVRLATRLLVSLAVAGMTAWGAGAIYYSNLPAPRLRGILAVTFVAATALAFLLLRRRGRTL